VLWYLSMFGLPIADLVYPPACLLCAALPADGAAPFCGGCGRAMVRLSAPVCRVCGAPLRGAHDLVACCRRCERQRPAFDQARAPLAFAGPVRDAVHAFKYQGRRRIGRWLAVEMARVAAREDWSRGRPLVVPVPMHRLKARLRGADSAGSLAGELAATLGLPYRPGLLRKTRWTGSQTRLDPRRRVRNVEGAFRAAEPLAGASVLLVDDVLTTGATAHACARALRAAGAAAVRVLTAASAAGTSE